MELSPKISLPAVLLMVLAGLAAGSTFISGRILQSFDLERKFLTLIRFSPLLELRSSDISGFLCLGRRCVRIAWIGRAEFAAGEVEYDFSSFFYLDFGILFFTEFIIQIIDDMFCAFYPLAFHFS